MGMADTERERGPAEQELQRKLQARLHAQLGKLATVLVLIAVGVAIWRLDTSLKESGLGYSLWESLGSGASAMPAVLLILGLGVIFSLGTTRIMLLAEKLYHRIRGKTGH
jgi:hypothetical protein